MENKSKEEILLEAKEKFLEEYSFQVPYDGSDNFYNEEKAKHAEAGWNECADHFKSQLKSKEEEVNKLREEKTAAYNQAIEDVCGMIEPFGQKLPVIRALYKDLQSLKK